jgi:hypothetical protein
MTIVLSIGVIINFLVIILGVPHAAHCDGQADT